ncbi:unnamed protein product [Rotaria magnacalcarata]|uniref:TTF-type domain-containing protein n=1 Tax=Rotaria magnacalcarata TaxID=392030 RepID=A0A816T7B9_9BILA|nr:unnamed protein product [Rotaria magnacalcarata]
MQQGISPDTSFVTNIITASSSIPESEISVEELSTNELICDLVEPNLVDLNESYFVTKNRGIIITKTTSEFISRDPSDNRKYNDDELRYLVSCGPYRDLNLSYPQNTELKKKNKQCSFTSNWYKNFPFLEYSIKKDACFCFCCRLFSSGPGSERAEDAWVTTGVSSWSKMTGKKRNKIAQNTDTIISPHGLGSDGKLVKHFKSITHTMAENRLLNFSQKRTNIDLMLNAQRRLADQKREEILKLNEKIVVTLLDVARFLSRQSLSFQGDADSERNFVAAVNMIRRCDPVLDQWFKDVNLRPYHTSYLHHDSQNELIKLLGSAVHKSILNDINNAPFISITTDSTMDASHKEIYTIVVRFVKNSVVQERIISVAQLNSKVGQDICEHILEQLKICGISTDKIIAQSYDNASNMSGKRLGVQACLSKCLNRSIMYIPCSTHSVNLVLQHGSRVSIDYINCFGILQELYNFFTGGIKRHALLCEELSKTSYGLLVKDLSKTRWSNRYEAIRAVIISYQQIMITLQKLSGIDIDNNTRQAATNLFKKLCSFTFYTVLLFLKNIMASSNALIVHLQKPEMDISTSIDMVKDTINLLHQMHDDHMSLDAIIEVSRKDLEKLNVNVDINVEFQRLRRRNKELKSLHEYYRIIFQKMIMSMNEEFKSYSSVLITNLKYFANLSVTWINMFSREDAKQICSIVPGIDDYELLFFEIQLLKSKIIEFNNIANVLNTIETTDVYPRAQRVFQYLLTIPISIATNERSFISERPLFTL